MAATTKSTNKQSSTKKSSTRKTATKRSPTKKTAAKKTTAKKTAAKKSPAKKSPAKKSPAKKSPAKKSPAKKSPAKKTTAKKSPAKKSPAKKSPAKKTTAKKTTAKKSPAKNSPAKKSPAKKSPAKKTTAKKTTAKKSPAKNSPAKKSPAKKTTRAGKSASKTATTRRDAIAVLEADHRKVENLFDEFERLGDRAHKTREATVSTIIEELSVHAGIEETVFYPAVRERFATADEPMVLEALEEHHLVKLTLNELESMSPEDERYAAKVTVLREVVDHHVEEEEKELFERVRAQFSAAELADLGNELTAARATAPTRPHPAAPDTPPGNIVANVLVAPLDAATNLTERAADAVRNAIG